MKASTDIIVLAVLLSLQNAHGAAPSTNRYRAQVHTNSEKNSFLLKAGYATFDSFSNATARASFTNTSELLKTVCEQSRPRWAERTGLTNWRRPIDIDVALGSDYQVFHWLNSARIDAAFVCPTALQFFRLGRTNAPGLVRLDAILGTNAALAFQPRLRSFVSSNPQPRPNPEEDFQTFLSSLTNRSSAAPFRLVAPSHLSAAGFITPVAYAHKWFKATLPAIVSIRSATESNFWHQFFAHMEFSLGNALPSATASVAETIVIEFSPDSLLDAAAPTAGWKVYTATNYIAYSWLTNALVARAAVAENIVPSPYSKDWLLPKDPGPVLSALAGNESLKTFLDPTFSLPELVSLIRRDQEVSGKDELALVLSGGGVKAAYQSALIDHLYSTRLLSNSTNAPRPALAVKNIVGNSGGALLGFFIAGLEENDSRRLTYLLWGAPNNLVTDRQIFGFWDMPRWASFVACIWFFILTLRCASALPGAWRQLKSRLSVIRSHAKESFISIPGIQRLRRQLHLVPVPINVRPEPMRERVTQFSGSPVALAHHPAEEKAPSPVRTPAHTLAFHYFVTIAGVLAATPVLFQIVNGEHGREHIPAIEGAFYFSCLALAMLIDNCLFPTPEAVRAHGGQGKLFVPAETARTWPPSGAAWLAILGFGAAAIPVAAEFLWRPRWVTQFVFDDKITLGGLILCCGLIAFWIGIILRLRAQNSRCLFLSRGDYVCALLLGVSVIALTYGVIYALSAVGIVTVLELTLPFWKWLIAITIAFSLIYFFLGQVNRCPSWLQKSPLVPSLFQRFKDAMKFQFAKHQSGTLGLSRLVRMHLIFTVGFFWWNLVVAPAFYGNSSARGYLQGAYDRFIDGKPYQLQTRYAAPANDLVANRERYFLFHPARDENSPLLTTLGNDERARWTVHAYSKDGHMKDVVFASGSPFPIFSPHAVRTRTDTNWLVDGGFAHNIPLEAAKEIGSRQVILLNSSPMQESTEAAPQTSRAGDSVFGQLFLNIPRLFPFLFHRSQIADFLVREQMFIVSLSPAPDKTWPPLFDFRKKTVQRLLDVAGQDTTKRIGRIETAGPPVFLISIRMGRDESRPDRPAPGGAN